MTAVFGMRLTRLEQVSYSVSPFGHCAYSFVEEVSTSETDWLFWGKRKKGCLVGSYSILPKEMGTNSLVRLIAIKRAKKMAQY